MGTRLAVRNGFYILSMYGKCDWASFFFSYLTSRSYYETWNLRIGAISTVVIIFMFLVFCMRTRLAVRNVFYILSIYGKCDWASFFFSYFISRPYNETWNLRIRAISTFVIIFMFLEVLHSSSVGGWHFFYILCIYGKCDWASFFFSYLTSRPYYETWNLRIGAISTFVIIFMFFWVCMRTWLAVRNVFYVLSIYGKCDWASFFFSYFTSRA